MRESSAPFVPDFGRPGFPVVTLPIAGDAHSPVAPKWPQDKKGVSQKRLTPCNYWSRGPDLLPRAEGVKELAGPKGRETDDLRVMSGPKVALRIRIYTNSFSFTILPTLPIPAILVHFCPPFARGIGTIRTDISRRRVLVNVAS